MALNKVSQQVTTAVVDRLKDPTTGFNIGINTQSLNYDLPQDFIQLDFTEHSQNFFYAQINPDFLEQSGIFKYPMGCIYTLESGQTGIQKFSQFSGIVRCVFEIFLSWKNIRGLHNHEAYANCVEDVVYDVINRVENQNWSNPLVYNGSIQCRRGPLAFAAENWRQRVGFSMLFEVHQ